MDREHAPLWAGTCHDRELLFLLLLSRDVINLILCIQDDDGFKLCESRTIARYLALKYAPESTLVPGTDDLRRYGLFEQAMSVEAFDFNPPIQAILFEKEKVYKQSALFLLYGKLDD